MNAIILGTGKMALTHASTLDNNKKISSFSICGRNIEKLKQFRKYKKTKYTETNLERLLAKSSFHIAIICLPHKLGADIINQLILKGCHILTEKPSFVSIVDAEKTLKYLSSEKKFLMVGYTLRYLKEIKQLKKIIQQGELGELKEISVRISRSVPNSGWINNPLLSTGVIGELAVHAIDLIRFLSEQEICNFSYDLKSLHQDRNVPDSLNMSVFFSNGLFAKINTSINIPIFDNEIIVAGEDAIAMIINGHVIIRPTTTQLSIKRLFIQDYLNKLKLPFGYITNNPYKAQLNEFIYSIENNKTPESDIAFDLPTIRVCQQLQIS